MPNLQGVLNDPDFKAASVETKREILKKLDPDFAASSSDTQAVILTGLMPPTIGQTTDRLVRNIVGPITTGVAGLVQGLANVGGTEQRAGFQRPPAPAGTPRISPEAETVAEAIVPQTPAELGATLALGAAGRYATRFGTAGGLQGAKAMGTRTAGATVGGIIGGGLSEEGPVSGGVKGALGVALGEVLGKGQELARRGLTNLTGGLYARDAKQIAAAIGDIVPSLRGAKSADELRDLVQSGTGRSRLFDMLMGAYDTIEQKTAGRLFSPQTTTRQVTSPIVTAQGRPITHAVSQTTGMSFKEVRNELRDLYKKGWSADDPLKMPTPAALEARDNFYTLIERTGRELKLADPKLAEQFRTARREFRVGNNVIDLLRRANGPSNRLFQPGGEGIAFNTEVLQNYLAAQEGRLRRKIGDQEVAVIAQEVFRGAPIGRGDTEGLSLGRLLVRKSPVAGGSFIESFPRVSIPYYAGSPRPFAVGPGRQTLLDLATQQGTARFLPAPMALSGTE